MQMQLVAVITALLVLEGVLGINVCGNGVCEQTGFPVETPTTCWSDCGGVNPCALGDECTDGSCQRPVSTLVDLDRDGVPDRLEYDLAHRFYPNMWIANARDLNDFYLRNGRHIPYLVQPYRLSGTICGGFRECIEIRFAMVFDIDRGDGVWPLDDLYSHIGDAEFYSVLLRRTASWTDARTNQWRWHLIRDYTQAHEGHTLSEHTKVGAYGYKPGGWCAVSAKCYANLPRTGPATIYSAEKKHGTYHTLSECEGGGFLRSDHCVRRYNSRSYKGTSRLQNIGSRYHHSLFDSLIDKPNGCGSHDVWTSRPFGDASDFYYLWVKRWSWCLPPAGAPRDCRSSGGSAPAPPAPGTHTL